MDKCPMCYGVLQKAKLLPCLDTVCFTCLDEHVVSHGRVTGTFPCPVCSIELPIPKGGVTKFEDNQHVKVEQSLHNIAANGSSRGFICEVSIYIVNICCVEGLRTCKVITEPSVDAGLTTVNSN